MAVVPIFNEDDRFIGLWAQNRAFVPTLGSLSELMGLAEPTFTALSRKAYTRIENDGIVRVGHNISFQDGIFLMIDGELPPPEDVKRGQPFVAISYHGIPIAKRARKPLEDKGGKWWRFWRRNSRAPSARITVGDAVKELMRRYLLIKDQCLSDDGTREYYMSKEIQTSAFMIAYGASEHSEEKRSTVRHTINKVPQLRRELNEMRRDSDMFEVLDSQLGSLEAMADIYSRAFGVS